MAGRLRTVWICLSLFAPALTSADEPNHYFAIEVVDEQTGRGVPMVELETTYGARYYTDSNGLIAFHEPGLMGRTVYFAVASHGYEFPADGFGLRGARLETTPGGRATLRIHRLNIAERLYRLTGAGIYRDTVLLGRTPPIAEPLLNAEVTGQDSVLNALYNGKLYWFWGDTSRLAYGLGNFATSGATSDSPGKIDPNVGIDLRYFTGPDGFSRKMAPLPGEGVVWISGLVVLPDDSGRDRMLAYFQRRRGLGAVLENGLLIFDDAQGQFVKRRDLPIDPPLAPSFSSSQRVRGDDGVERIVFCAPYPALRVKADLASYLDLSTYEGYTCLKPGARPPVGADQLERDADGRLVWGWKPATPPLGPREQAELVKARAMTREESPFRLQDADDGRPIELSNASCFWNEYRKKYVMIASEVFGATMLGETWYAEAARPEGPWVHARKIITHANKKGDAHDFYNPTQHPFLDRDGGRVIYLEGTYVNTFSGNIHPTPYYEYNQIFYRLDLADPRLTMPR